MLSRHQAILTADAIEMRSYFLCCFSCSVSMQTRQGSLGKKFTVGGGTCVLALHTLKPSLWE